MKNFMLLCAVVLTISLNTSCKKAGQPTPITNVDSLKIGLIAYYPFNNSGVDSSGTGNNVYYYHGITSTTDRFNKANSAFSFDGISSYMIVKDTAPLRLNNTDFTLNIWVNLESYNNSYGTEILSKRGPGNNNGWNYGITGDLNQSNNGYPLGANSFGVSGGTDPAAVGLKMIGLNNWHMLTTVYNLQKKQINFYVDGVLDNTTGYMPSPNSLANPDLYIGQDSQGGGATAYYLKGKLDDVRIYGRALSLSQIQKLFISIY